MMQLPTFYSPALLFVFLLAIPLFSGAQDQPDGQAQYRYTSVAAKNVPEGMDQAWKLSMKNMAHPIMVCLEHRRHQTIYHVRTKMVILDYVADKHHFGLKVCRLASPEMPESILQQILNRKEEERQSVLTAGRVDSTQALALIGAYFEDLINPGFQIQ